MDVLSPNFSPALTEPNQQIFVFEAIFALVHISKNAKFPVVRRACERLLLRAVADGFLVRLCVISHFYPRSNVFSTNNAKSTFSGGKA
jgi:hypothetical protein